MDKSSENSIPRRATAASGRQYALAAGLLLYIGWLYTVVDPSSRWTPVEPLAPISAPAGYGWVRLPSPINPRQAPGPVGARSLSPMPRRDFLFPHQTEGQCPFEVPLRLSLELELRRLKSESSSRSKGIELAPIAALGVADCLARRGQKLAAYMVLMKIDATRISTRLRPAFLCAQEGLKPDLSIPSSLEGCSAWPEPTPPGDPPELLPEDWDTQLGLDRSEPGWLASRQDWISDFAFLSLPIETLVKGHYPLEWGTPIRRSR